MPGEPIFRPFDPYGEVRVYVRNLPHWRQPGATYFVTFRQDDSIPEHVLAEWLDTRQRWYRAHGLDLQWRDSDPERFAAADARVPEGVRRAFEREQARMLHEELDRCHGSCVLRYAGPQKCVSDSLGFFHGQRLWLGDFVIMPNHVPALLIPFDGDRPVQRTSRPSESDAVARLSESSTQEPLGGWELEDLLGSIKKWTSRLIGRWLLEQPEPVRPAGPTHSKSRLWQHESYDRIVRDAEELAAFRRYIARNPLAANLKPGEFVYYAAPWLDLFAVRPEPDSESRATP